LRFQRRNPKLRVQVTQSGIRFASLERADLEQRGMAVSFAIHHRRGSIPSERLAIPSAPKSYAAGLEMCRPGGACVGPRRKISSRHCVTQASCHPSPRGLVPTNGNPGWKKPNCGKPMDRSESPATVGRHADVDSRPAPAQAPRVGIFCGPTALQARARNFRGRWRGRNPLPMELHV
jgi:hypothetical protein